MLCYSIFMYFPLPNTAANASVSFRNDLILVVGLSQLETDS